ncbi:MAG: hypothetical protein ACXVC1_08585 [Tumebacillaceae bacterium]
MEKQPRLELVSGAEAVEQLRQFPLPVDTGILHIPNQLDELTWPMLVPQGGVQVSLQAGSENQLTYGIVTGIIAFEETFHLLGRVDYAYGEQEGTSLFRLDWQHDRQMIETIAELGILVLSNAKPPKMASKEELIAFLSDVPTFVCEIDKMELHRLHIQMIRMNAQEKL